MITVAAEEVARRPGAADTRELAIFTSHPIQYQAPIFRALATSATIDPLVYFGSRHGADVAMDRGFGTAFQWDVPLLDGYRHSFLPNQAKREDVSRFRGVRIRNASDVLAASRPDVLLVYGWHTVAHLQMIRAAQQLGIPVMLRGDSTLQRTPVDGALGVARRIMWLPARQRLYEHVFRGIDGFLVVGSRNRDYYRSFGVPEDRLFWAPNVVDNDRFALDERGRHAARERRRSELGLARDAIVFASAAKLIGLKRPLDLVDAIARLRQRGVKAHAVFVGDGEERRAVEQRADEAGITNAVFITGFVNQQAMPEWYAAADALVLPSSTETWGLVVNEAMAAGLPVVLSDAVGCAVDLVEPGRNGFTYPLGDVSALAERLTTIAELNDDGRAALGVRSRQIIRRFCVEGVVGAIETAVDTICARRAPAHPKRQ